MHFDHVSVTEQQPTGSPHSCCATRLKMSQWSFGCEARQHLRRVAQSTWQTTTPLLRNPSSSDSKWDSHTFSHSCLEHFEAWCKQQSQIHLAKASCVLVLEPCLLLSLDGPPHKHRARRRRSGESRSSIDSHAEKGIDGQGHHHRRTPHCAMTVIPQSCRDGT